MSNSSRLFNNKDRAASVGPSPSPTSESKGESNAVGDLSLDSTFIALKESLQNNTNKDRAILLPLLLQAIAAQPEQDRAGYAYRIIRELEGLMKHTSHYPTERRVLITQIKNDMIQHASDKVKDAIVNGYPIRPVHPDNSEILRGIMDQFETAFVDRTLNLNNKGFKSITDEITNSSSTPTPTPRRSPF